MPWWTRLQRLQWKPKTKLQRLLCALDTARRYKAAHARVCAKFEELLEADRDWANLATRWYAQVAAFMASLSGDGATTWKDAWPAEERMRLEPELLRSGVSLELNLPQESITRAHRRGVQTCTCQHCTSHRLTLCLDDPDMVHRYLTRKEESSERGGSAYGSHNAIRDVVCDIARHAGHPVITTGLGVFLQTDDRSRILDILIQDWVEASMRTLNGDPIGSMRKTREAI